MASPDSSDLPDLPEEWLPPGATQNMHKVDENFRQELTRVAGHAAHYRAALINNGIEEDLADHMTAEWSRVFWTVYFTAQYEEGEDGDEQGESEQAGPA